MFFNIAIMDVIDVVLVAFLLYYLYRVMKDSGSLNVFLGILMFIFSWLFVSKLLQMRLLGSIFDQLMSVGTLALVIIFQEEIRNFFRTLGSHRQLRFLSRFFSRDKKEDATDVLPIVLACNSMAQQKVGALIVVQRNMSLDDIVKTGETINADISQRLIEAVFFKNAPLHDGAMVIQNGRITAAQCILPVSHNLNISKKLGLRHRSAIGVTESYDAIAIVVSEETGAISAAIGGKLMQNLDARKLEEILNKEK
ncbi:MAG: diadenylate cyclase CdaA [Bacteroidaceae bacterium]|nr:diadenylate cyclase CdaA [Bacteroidaceae bacterium]